MKSTARPTSRIWSEDRPRPVGVDVFVSRVKEPGFFAYGKEPPNFTGPGDAAARKRFIARASYEALFADRTMETAIGEASVIYLHHPSAPDFIRDSIPHVKLIAILRNPIDRGYSSFTRNRQAGREPLSDYLAAVRAEDDRLNQGWSSLFGYARNGLYFKHLSRYFVRFPRSQIKVYLFEDLQNRPLWLLRDLFEFLGVDPDVPLDVMQNLNKSGTSSLPWLDHLIRRESLIKTAVRHVLPRSSRSALVARWSTTLRKTELSPHARGELRQYYKTDLRNLEGMLDVDLSHWLS